MPGQTPHAASGEPSAAELAFFTLLRLGACLMLVWTMSGHSDWFYVALRFLVFAAAAYGAWYSARIERLARPNAGHRWPYGFVAVAVLFFPIVPVSHAGVFWRIVDVAVAAFFVASVYYLRIHRDATHSWLELASGTTDPAGPLTRPLTIEERIIFLAAGGIFGLVLVVAALYEIGLLIGKERLAYVFAAAGAPLAILGALAIALWRSSKGGANTLALAPMILALVFGPVAGAFILIVRLLRMWID